MKFSSAFAAVAALFLTVDASPTAGKPKCHRVGGKVTATFDDIKVTPPLPIVGQLLTRPPKPYKGLNYEGFGVESDEFKILGVNPYSGKNDAFYSVLTRLTQFTAARIYTKPKQYIDLHSLHYSCSVDVDLVRQPLDCNIVMSSVDYAGRSISTTLGFEAQGNDMEGITFGSNFDTIKQISFTTVADARAEALTTQIDSISYTIYQCE